MSLQKVIRKYYSHVIEQGEKPEKTAERILEEMQQYKMLTHAELFQYAKNFSQKAMQYCYPNSTGVPEAQKELLNEFFTRCLTGEHVNPN